jgi:hypothetical protein
MEGRINYVNGSNEFLAKFFDDFIFLILFGSDEYVDKIIKLIDIQ